MKLAIINSNASIFLANIELQPNKEEDEIHTAIMIDEESKDVVENMMLTYQSNKAKTTGIELH